MFDKYKYTYNDVINQAVSFSGLNVDHFTKAKAYLLLDKAGEFFSDLSEISVLDVGCGIGNIHHYFKNKFKRLSGVDISDGAVEEAAKRNKWVEYEVFDGSVFPYQDNCFDLVYTVNVMHHVSPELRADFLAQITRVLRPNGMFVVFEHNPFNPMTRYVVRNCEFDRGVSLLRQKEMEVLIECAGLRINSSTAILTIPHLGPLTRWFDSKFGRLPFGAQYLISAMPDVNKNSIARSVTP